MPRTTIKCNKCGRVFKDIKNTSVHYFMGSKCYGIPTKEVWYSEEELQQAIAKVNRDFGNTETLRAFLKEIDLT